MTDDERFEQACRTWVSSVRPHIDDEREPSRAKSGTVAGLFILRDDTGDEMAAFRFREGESQLETVRPSIPPTTVGPAADMGLPPARPTKKKKKKRKGAAS